MTKKKRGPARRHLKNSFEFAAFAASVARTGQMIHVQVLHDEACTPSVCTCDPEYIVEELTAESYRAGQAAQNDWVRKSTS